MNPWLVAAGVAAVASPKGRQLVRKGAVHGLAAVISIGEAAVATAHEATTEAGHAASGVAHGASRGASAVTGLVGGLVSDARQQAQGGRGAEEPPAEARASAS